MKNNIDIKKAVLLCAGKGVRLLPLTQTIPKHLIPIAGKPLIQYLIEYLKDVGISDILLVVGHLKEEIIKYLGTGQDFGLKINYIEQKEYLGTAHATKLAKEFIGNSYFFLIYGDLFFNSEIVSIAKTKFINLLLRENIESLICLKQVKDPEKFGIIQLDNNGFLINIVEKPKDNKFGNLANAGIYIFSPRIFECIEETKKSVRNEYELTDSIRILKDKNFKIFGLDISNYFWSDIGHPWQIFDANTYQMDKLKIGYDCKKAIKGIIENNVTIKNEVYIGKDSIIKSGTYIEGPVIIGENSVIGPNSYIRPYTCIGNSCRVGNTVELKNTILMDGCFVSHLSYIGDSIIGRGVNFGAGSKVSNVRLDKKEIYMVINDRKVPTGRTKMGAVIGDNVQIGINASIMTGIKIGANSYIGPSTIVKEDVPPNTIYYFDQNFGIKKKSLNSI